MIKRLISMFFGILLFVSVLPYAVFAEGTVTILTERKVGDSSVSKPRPGTMSEVSYKIQLDGADSDASLFNWSVSPENQGVSVDDNGNVRISGDTTLPSFTLTASLRENPSVTGTKAVEIKDTCFYDFDNNSPDAISTAKENGNVYMSANSENTDKYTNMNFNEYMALQAGQSTIEFKFRVPAANASVSQGYHYYLAENRWGTYVSIANRDAAAKTFSMQLVSGVNRNIFATGITYDEWHKMKIEFNYNTMTYKFYVDGAASDETSIPTETREATQLKLKYDIDDVTAYTGFDHTPLSIADSSKSILIPTVNNRTASVKFDASSDDASAPITWSLAESYVGVEIDPQTGLVTVSNAANPGDVSVKATQGAYEKTATLSLTKFYEDFESFSAGSSPSSAWSKGSVVDDGGNKYLSDSKGDTLRLKIPASNASNNLVLEADIGYGNATITLYAINNSSWQTLAKPTTFDVFNTKSWNKLKIVFDYKNAKYWVFINETLIANQDFAALSEQKQFGFANANIDNVRMYNVSNTAPQAINVKLSDVWAGSDAVLSYDYFDESGMPEDGTSIQWYSSDSATSGFQPVEGANTAALNTSGMAGKYLKAVITPAHRDEFNSNASITGEAVEKVCRVLENATVEAITVNGQPVNFNEINVKEKSTVLAVLKLETAPNTEKTFLLALAYYQDDKLSEIDYKVVTLGTSENSRSESLTLTAGAGDYKIFAWDHSKLVPLIKSPSFQ